MIHRSRRMKRLCFNLWLFSAAKNSGNYTPGLRSSSSFSYLIFRLRDFLGEQDDVRFEATNMEGKGEQQEEREEAKSHRGEDILWSENVRQLQAPQALRQQWSLEGSLQRGWLDCWTRRYHISQGTLLVSFLLSAPIVEVCCFTIVLVFLFESFAKPLDQRNCITSAAECGLVWNPS